jgi:DNA-binding MarR family transcriptional regulator
LWPQSINLPAIAMPDATDHEDRLGHLLWEVSSYTTALGDAALADSPLSHAGIGILNTVAAEPGITVAEIARRTPKTPQAVSQVAARLEKLGLLERRLAEGRGVALHLTDAGHAAQAEGDAREEAFEQSLREALGAARYTELRTLLGEARAIVADLLARPSAG